MVNGRPGELANFAGEVSIRATNDGPRTPVKKFPSGGVLQGEGFGKGIQLIHGLDPQALDVVYEHERSHANNPYRLLRPTRTGQPYRSNNWIRQAWLPALRRAGLEGSGLTPHGLRHSRLSIMAATGQITLGDLSKFAGHASVAFTLTRYGDHFSSAGIRPELYLGTQAAS